MFRFRTAQDSKAAEQHGQTIVYKAYEMMHIRQSQCRKMTGINMLNKN
jgi:hypothetical protein